MIQCICNTVFKNINYIILLGKLTIKIWLLNKLEEIN